MEDKSLKWHRRFLDLATTIASWSKDPSTKVGAIIAGPDYEIRSTGYNGSPRGFEDGDVTLWERAYRLSHTVHAETNAIYHAARIGVSVRGCTVYITLPPCVNCAMAIAQAGISEVVYYRQEIPERWQAELEDAERLLNECGVTVTVVEKDLVL